MGMGALPTGKRAIPAGMGAAGDRCLPGFPGGSLRATILPGFVGFRVIPVGIRQTAMPSRIRRSQSIAKDLVLLVPAEAVRPPWTVSGLQKSLWKKPFSSAP